MAIRPVFPLQLHRTYYNQGFFNVTRDFDRYVRPDDGPVTLALGEGGRELEARVTRRANTNGTARVIGGAELRDWLRRNYREGDTAPVRLDSLRRMTLGAR